MTTPEWILLSLLLTILGFYLGWTLQKKVGRDQLQKDQEERVQRLVAYWLSKSDEKKEIWGNHSKQIVEHALRQAIENEDYEDAANLRDILKKMEDGDPNPFDDLKLN